MLADDLLAGLDEQQRQAVTSDDLPLCILAGAGSGKTRVLTRRIAWRCVTGRSDPRRVLALTFTRAAARELASRLRALGVRDEVRAGTFHAVAWAELRAWHRSAGRHEPTLLERPARVVRRVIDADAATVADLCTEIAWAKSRFVPPERFGAESTRARRTSAVDPGVVADVYDRYEREKQRRGLVDFDDLLGHLTRALEQDREAAAAQQWRFAHLYVDEFQDVNPLQFRLLAAWRGGRDDLCVVGDPNQAIYGWNGADVTYLERFTELVGGAVLSVDHSYRSTSQILATANALLDAGALGGVRLRSVRGDGPAPTVTSYDDGEAESRAVARAMRDAHGPSTSWSHQAALVRTNAQLVPLGAALDAAGIPYRVRGRARLMDAPAVRAALDELGGPGRSFVEGLARLEGRLDDLDDASDGHEELRELVALANAYQAEERAPNTDGFRSWLAANRAEHGRHHDAVTVATFHAAKGLEWPIVYVCGLEDGFVPISHATSRAALLEERRLLYVACTRAERHLRLSWAGERTMGETRVTRRPSPFLDDLGPILHAMAQRDRPADWRAHLPAVRHAASVEDGATTSAVDALRAWRDRRARGAGVPAHAVLADHVLDAIARRQPQNAQELAGIDGAGPLLLGGLADDLLAVLETVQGS
ncbi:MAG: ATP-dependent helicase [Acidimicrobiales bacterium]